MYLDMDSAVFFFKISHVSDLIQYLSLSDLIHLT